MKKFYFWTLMFFVIVFWAAAFAAIRYIVTECNVSPMALLIYRFVPTALISIIAVLVFFRKDNLEVIRKVWVELAGISFLMLIGYHLVLNIGETKIPAGPSGLIIGTYPLFTLLFAALLIKEKLTWQKVIGGLLGFAGIAILVFNGSQDLSPDDRIETAEWIKYGLITLIAPIAVAFQTILSKTLLTGENRAGVKLNPAHSTLLCMIPAIILLPFILFIPDFPNPMTLSAGFWWSLALLIFGSTFISYLGWMWAIKLMGAGRTAVTTTYSIPLVSLVIAWMFLGEELGPMTTVSAVFIIAGMIVTNINGRAGQG